MDLSMSANQTMWSATLPNGEVRSGTLEQLNEALQSGHLGAGTLVRASGSDQWATLAEVLEAMAKGITATPVRAPGASVPPPPVDAPLTSPRVNGTPELWRVRLADGQERSGTREQLEEAFRAGHLSEEMLVLAGGAPEWVKLGAVMGRNEPLPAPVAAPPASVESAPPSSPAPSTATTSPSAPGSDELWQVRLADGQLRSGTRQQLEEAFRAGHLDGSALVLAAGAGDWVPLATIAARLSSAPQPASDAESQAAPQAQATPGETPPAQWQVRLSYDQLEEAFRAGLLDSDSQVMAIGTDQWIRLGDLRSAQGGDSRRPEDARA
jgi:hypothetical protein